MFKEEEIGKSREEKVCELCREQPAKVLCSECYKCYCDRCSEFIHSLPLLKEHKMETLFEGVKVNAMCPIHNDIPLKMLYIDEVKLCCSMCKLENLQKKHNVVKLSDIPKDNEIFSASEVMTHFADVMKCDDELDNKIEKIIEGIDDEVSKVKENIGQTFKEAHKRLDEEEENIMKNLESVYNENKGALIRNLGLLGEVREYSKILNETFSKINEESSRLMELNLVSEMEKQRKAMDELHRMKMTDLKIGWDREGRKLSFTKTLFNGAPTPNNISFPVVLNRGFEVSWNCDESELNEEDKSKIKYVVEVEKTDVEEDEWKEVYSGKDKKCGVKDLDKNTEYDVRVKCVIGELQGGWSDVVSVKTKDISIDSSILSGEMNGNVFEKKLSEWCKTTNFELLCQGTKNGFGASDFHRACDNKGKTLVLIKNTSGHIFGGFVSVPWTSSNVWKQAPGSFLFTLTNMHEIQPTKFLLKNENDGNAVYDGNTYGPIFGNGHDLYIYNDCNTNTSSCTYFPCTYNDTTGKGMSIFSSNTGSRNFQVKEIEVFRVNV